MRVELEDIIQEISLRMGQEKSLRNRVLLEKAHSHLVEYKKTREKLV